MDIAPNYQTPYSNASSGSKALPMDLSGLSDNGGASAAMGMAMGGDPYMMAAQAVIGGVGDIQSAIMADYSHELGPENFNGMTDLNAIRNMEYAFGDEGYGYSVMDTSFNHAANAIRGYKRMKAEAEFNQQKQQRLRTGISRNAAFNNRDRYMSNLGQSSMSQVDRYLNSIS